MMIEQYKKYIPAGTVLLFLITSYYFYSFFRLGDDTFIYLQYVKNLLTYGEFSFNQGIVSYGFTSPLWLFMLAGLVLIGVPVLHTPALLSLVFGALSVYLWALIILKSKLQDTFKLLFLLLIIFDPNLQKHAYLGMEATASFFLSSLFLYMVLIRPIPPSPFIFGILGGIYFFIRPESMIIYGLMGFYLLQTKKYSIRNILTALLSTILIVLPWLIFAFYYFGSIFPATFAAKGGSFKVGVLILNHVMVTAKIVSGNYFIHFLLFLFIIIKLKKVFLSIKESYAIITIVCVILFYFISLNAEVMYARYLCVVFPFMFFLFLNQSEKLENPFPSLLLGVSLVGIIVLVFAFSTIHKQSWVSGEKAEDTIIQWVKSNTAPNAKLVRVRIGKIGYFSERYIVDPVGLINADIIPYRVSGNVLDYYRIVRPDYFISDDDSVLKKLGIINYNTVKEFTFIDHPMVRDWFASSISEKKVRVYKVEW